MKLLNLNGQLLFEDENETFAATLVQAVKENTALYKLDATRQELKHIDLTGAQLQSAVFDYADLTATNLNESVLCGASLQHTQMSHTMLHSANLTQINGYATNFTGASLNKSEINNGVFECCNFTLTELIGVNAGHAEFVRCKFRDNDMTDSDFHGVEFGQSLFNSVTFKNSNLRGADFSGAHFTATSLKQTEISRTNFTGALLQNVFHNHARVQFNAHGECGRELVAIVKNEGDEPTFHCGCFSGSVKDLQKYITQGNQRYAKTRLIALEAVLKLIDVEY
jgi:uncharacterized protein YjbI with pentapeptide repeats